MAEEKVSRGGKGQQDSKKGKPRSAGKSKGKIVGYYGSGRLAAKKARRVARQARLGTSPAGIRRREAREARSQARFVAACARHEAARQAEREAAAAAQAVVDEKKAKRSAAAISQMKRGVNFPRSTSRSTRSRVPTSARSVLTTLLPCSLLRNAAGFCMRRISIWTRSSSAHRAAAPSISMLL